MVLPYTVLHEESEKKYEKIQKTILIVPTWPECGYFAKTSIFVFSVTFLGFFGLSMIIIGLEKLSKAYKH